ncbi:MAG TPA: two-component system response regulator [Ruminococcaceae bacterium]|nr:two-component system response regulator [Oscillospiraceae bacterium]
MLRLIIVDDEKIIRETIRNLIDWQSLGIKVVGVCKNGIEAYDTILDEYPDIVLTDIKMPGLSGLELIQRISQTDKQIEFVILSGYGEFSFAKEAMKYGVKHYLLKPCSESEIIDVMKQVAETCSQKKASADRQQQQLALTKNFRESIIRNIIVEGLSFNSDFSMLVQQYERFLDFSTENYELCYVYFLEQSSLGDFLEKYYAYTSKNSPNIPAYSIYVKNTLLTFFQGYNSGYSELDSFMRSYKPPSANIEIEYERVSYPNLSSLLSAIIHKLKRYEIINIVNGQHLIPTCNYNALYQSVERLSQQLAAADERQYAEVVDELKELISSVNDADFAKVLITSIMLKLPLGGAGAGNPLLLTEFMLELNQLSDINEIRDAALEKLTSLCPCEQAAQGKGKDFIDKTVQYVETNLSNPNLSLKWIADNYLFMNVDYLSKQFVRQMGCKFSTFLTNLRIEKAKQMLINSDADKIYLVAKEVGCGNNPQYFSQIFKKNTGMTPTEYIKKIGGN